MTVTSHPPGARAPHRRSVRRLLATAVTVLIAWAVPAPADAATPTPQPSATEVLSGERDLDVIPSSNGMLRPGQALTVSVSLDNGLATATTTTPVALSLGTRPLRDRAALNAWLESGDSDPGAQIIGSPVLPAAASGSDVSAAATLLPDDPLLAGRAAGVYTLSATADVGDQSLSARSVVTVPAEPTTPIGVVVPITAGPLESGLLSSDALARLTATDGELTAQLAAVDGTGAILAVDPAIAASIRVLGSGAPATATAWLDRLVALPNSRFALQFADADLATQIQAGLARPLQPTSLLAYMDANDFAPDVEATPTPIPTPTAASTATPEPEGPVYPDLAALIDIGGAPRPATYWPATGSAGADVVAALGALGEDDTASVTLLASTSTTAGADGITVPAAGSADGASVLVYDASASAHLAAGAGAADADARDAALVTATADLAFATADAAGRPLAVTVDRGTDRTRVDLRAAISSALSSASGALSLEQLVATPAEPVQVADIADPPSRVADPTLLMNDEAEIADFATILDDPQLLTGPQRAEILQLLGTAWLDDPEASQRAVAAHRAETTATLDSVGIVSTNVVLVSYGSEGFRPHVRNDLGYPVNLMLVATSDTASLDLPGSIPPVRAEAGSNTLVTLPIEARIANATAVVSMQLYSPTMIPIGKLERATVEVHAEWETIALAVLGGLLVLFLSGGIVRTILRRRRARAAKADADGAAAPPGTDRP